MPVDEHGNLIPPKETPKSEEQEAPAGFSYGKKTASSPKPQMESPKCPRCDSSNTKFCYYNNYSLSQPRHFCKTCRRYWTKGGALRNVPIGGGCRKSKKMKSSSSSSSSSRLLSGETQESSSDFKFFQPAPMDFQLGGLSFPRIDNTAPLTSFYSQFTSFDPSVSSLMALNYSLPNYSQLKQGENAGFSFGLHQDMAAAGSMDVNSSLASSIESLSYINQDLHWKLQQQRLGILYGGEENISQKETVTTLMENQVHKPQPILFQNKPDDYPLGNPRLFDSSSYAPLAAITSPPNNSSNWEWNPGLE